MEQSLDKQQENARFICEFTLRPTRPQKSALAGQAWAVSPKVENAVRALLHDSIEGGYKPWAPAEKAQNVPLLIANAPQRLVPVGFYNHGTGRLRALSAHQASFSILQGVNTRAVFRALLSMSYAAVGTGCGVFAWLDNKYETKAYVPLDALYEAVRFVQDKKLMAAISRGEYKFSANTAAAKPWLNRTSAKDRRKKVNTEVPATAQAVA